jgi:hypothetical protein
MAIVVVGGSHRGAGKTALVCGLIAALPEFRWMAVKITTHGHGRHEKIWEETKPGQGTDTARYLAAGAERALLMTASSRDLPELLSELWRMVGPRAKVLFESNRVLEQLRPDLCLVVHSSLDCAEPKPSFSQALRHADAVVALAGADRVLEQDEESKPIFHLAALERVSPEMLAWLRLRLPPVQSS